MAVVNSEKTVGAAAETVTVAVKTTTCPVKCSWFSHQMPPISMKTWSRGLPPGRDFAARSPAVRALLHRCGLLRQVEDGQDEEEKRREDDEDEEDRGEQEEDARSANGPGRAARALWAVTLRRTDVVLF